MNLHFLDYIILDLLFICLLSHGYGIAEVGLHIFGGFIHVGLHILIFIF